MTIKKKSLWVLTPIMLTLVLAGCFGDGSSNDDTTADGGTTTPPVTTPGNDLAVDTNANSCSFVSSLSLIHI